MVDKRDLDELEKWNTQRIINEKEKSKFYYEEFTKNKKIDKFSKVLKNTTIILRIITHIIVFIGLFFVFALLHALMSRGM